MTDKVPFPGEGVGRDRAQGGKKGLTLYSQTTPEYSWLGHSDKYA